MIRVRFLAAAFFVAIKCCNELPDITTYANILLFIFIHMFSNLSFLENQIKYISQHNRQSQAGGIPLLYMLYTPLTPM